MVITARHFHGYHLSSASMFHHIKSVREKRGRVSCSMSAVSSDHRSANKLTIDLFSFSMYLIQLSNLFFNTLFFWYPSLTLHNITFLCCVIFSRCSPSYHQKLCIIFVIRKSPTPKQRWSCKFRQITMQQKKIFDFDVARRLITLSGVNIGFCDGSERTSNCCFLISIIAERWDFLCCNSRKYHTRRWPTETREKRKIKCCNRSRIYFFLFGESFERISSIERELRLLVWNISQSV